MTTRVMVTVNGTAHEAHVVTERRNEHGQFVRDEHVMKVRGREDGQGFGFGEVWLVDNAQVIISEHPVRQVGDPPTTDRENDGA